MWISAFATSRIFATAGSSFSVGNTANRKSNGGTKPRPATKTVVRSRAPSSCSMKFVIIGFDGADGEAKRKIHRPAHLANMEPLDRAGRVVLAGPLTDKAGSLIVIEADSLEEAQKFGREE